MFHFKTKVLHFKYLNKSGEIKRYMKKENIFKIVLLAAPLLCVNFSCTKLNTKVHDQVVNFWQTDDQIAAGVAPAYSGLRNYAPANDIYGLSEVCTDEIIVPNRALDWADDVVWEELWKHTWTPNNKFVQSAWQFIYSGIARVNLILQTLNGLKPTPADITSIQAELKTIRAFYYYLAIDLYGNVPIHEVGVIDRANLATKTRKEVFDYTEKELKDNLQALTTDVNSKTYGRATRWLTYAILAKLYLNAEVFTGTTRWADCIAACDAILNANKYSLEPNFFNNFLVANEGSKENIFVIPFDGNAGLGDFWIQLASLHYSSHKTFGLKPFAGIFGGFNGHCSTAEYYNMFDPNDNRRKMFLVGQQYENQIVDA